MAFFFRLEGIPEDVATDYLVAYYIDPAGDFTADEIKGLAGLLGCSVATAQRIKSGGAIDGSYVQRKKEIIFDAEKVLQFFDDPYSRWGIVYLWSRRFVSPAGHFDCSFGLWGESWGESETENRPLKQMRSRLRVPRAGIRKPVNMIF